MSVSVYLSWPFIVLIVILYSSYSSSKHRDVVRGLAWNPAEDGVLRSCGLDSQLLCHSILRPVEESGSASMETDNIEQKAN
jgi:hypothetical protein